MLSLTLRANLLQLLVKTISTSFLYHGVKLVRETLITVVRTLEDNLYMENLEDNFNMENELFTPLDVLQIMLSLCTLSHLRSFTFFFFVQADNCKLKIRHMYFILHSYTYFIWCKGLYFLPLWEVTLAIFLFLL